MIDLFFKILFHWKVFKILTESHYSFFSIFLDQNTFKKICNFVMIFEALILEK